MASAARLASCSQALAPPPPYPLPTKHGSFRQEGQLRRGTALELEIGLEKCSSAAVDAALRDEVLHPTISRSPW